jgi:enoyl-[acyl-carrier-protein] reductase (NADH)
MNQFGNYEPQLKKCSEAWKIANDFDYILNNIWCTYSFEKGKTRWKEIKSQIPESYRFRIDIEIDHVWLGHGIDQARMTVKDEMEKYLDYLNSEIYC